MMKVKDVKPGYKLQLKDGGAAEVISCGPMKLIQSASGEPWCWELTYRDGDETGTALLASDTEVSVLS
jgi:hypothetical protein